ncbi:MAG: hypothetical protein LBL80_00265 [Ruminococcus sp.]|jgi:hypothetical protein|nr:hypothetical protein [Ruminococcus sp.]
MSKNIKDYKSEMQNLQFSPDFVSKTVASLSEAKAAGKITVLRQAEQIIEPSRPRYNIIRNISVALAACFLCVFTVNLVMRQNDLAENITAPEVQIPEITVLSQETSIEIIEEIGEFTPFAALPEIVDTESLPEPQILGAGIPETMAASSETIVTTAVNTVTVEKTAHSDVADVPVTTVAETAAAGLTSRTAVENKEESAPDDAESIEDSPVDDAASDEDTVMDDAASEEDSAEEMEYDSEITIASSDEQVLNAGEFTIDNSEGYDAFGAYELMSLENCNALLRYKDNSAIFLDNNKTTVLAGNAAEIIKSSLTKNSTVQINSADIEFQLSITDSGNVKYVIYLFTDSLVIAVYDGSGNYTLSAVNIKAADYKNLFGEMYSDLFTQAQYELYIARESGK